MLPSFEFQGPPGAPVVMLSHSLGTHREMWAPQLAALTSRFRVLLYDHRGHGKSALPDGPWTIDDFGRDAINLLDELGLERVRFVGLSLGGIVGLWLGQEAPERVEQLVLSSCSATIENPALLRGRLAQIREKGIASIENSVLDRWFTDEFEHREPFREMLLGTPAEGYARTCEMLCEFDLRPGLTSIPTPALVTLGLSDAATPPDWTRAMAAELPNARLEEFSAAHMLNAECADGFNRLVLEFFQSTR